MSWVMLWTRAKINDWKWFACICFFATLLLWILCARQASPHAERYISFKNCSLTNNADYRGTPELSSESSVVELGCPPSCRGQHSQPGFSRDVAAENPPEVLCEDNKPFFTAPVLMSTHTKAFPLPVPTTAAHSVTLLNCLPGRILFLFFCLHPCKLQGLITK